MTKETFTKLIKEKFGENLYQKSIEFPNNKMNLIFLRNNPIKIKGIILDNDREFHIIINQKKEEIFHDCPSFLIHSEREKKVCVHLIKLLFLIKKPLALSILNEFEQFKLTSEDFGSKKKSKNFSILAENCFKSNNCIEGLNYLNKAIINQCECETIIEQYLKTAIKNNLFIEFFEFLKSGYENDLEDYFLNYLDYIEDGFKRFLDAIKDYAFFDLLRIIKSIDKIFESETFSLMKSLGSDLRKKTNSSILKEKYFSMYLIEKYHNQLIKLDPVFNNIYSQDQLEQLKTEMSDYFLSEIENLCLIDKLKLLKNQFKILNIPEERFHNAYKNYKREIKEIEKKVYLKKFSYIKLLMEKYNIKRAKGDFRKKRNTYIVNHNQENLNNPVYSYIISRIGFYGPNEQTIKSTDIGLNYFIIKELFFDDLSSIPDILYYRKQFWGDNDVLEVNSIDGFSLLSELISYNYDIVQKYSNREDLMIIEWDLANKPRLGSLVNAYGSQIIIPDHNNPLFHDLKPFDLCYCKKHPVKIEGNIIKTINVITKCSFKDAINNITKGMAFIEGYYPLSLVKAVLNKELSPFKANEIVLNNPNKLFVPNYHQFIKDFRTFLYSYINQEKDYIFEELKLNPEENTNQFLILLDLNTELAGLNLNYPKIIEELLSEGISLISFKSKFLVKIHSSIQELLNQHDIGATLVFDLKKLRNTSFFKYSNEILKIRKEEFENSKIIKTDDRYNISEICETYYGKKFLKILNLEGKKMVKSDKFKKLVDISSQLNLHLKILT